MTKEKKPICIWSEEDENSYYYNTHCGHIFYFNDGDLTESNFKWCPFCGRPIKEVLEQSGGI